MHNYLLKISKINTKNNDITDYETFCSAAIKYLEETNDHQDFITPLLKGLVKVKNIYLIHILYKIAAKIKTTDNSQFIPHFIIEKHLKNHKTKGHPLPYLLSKNINTFDLYIKENLVENCDFVSKDLLDYILVHPHLGEAFMFMEDRKYLSKQLSFIIDSKLTYNLKYYFQFLGSNSKLFAFKAFEAFSSIFPTIENFGFINSTDCIQIENLAHFLTFSSCFLPEKDEISESLIYKDLSKLNKILKKYNKNLKIEEKDILKISPLELGEIKTYKSDCTNTFDFNYLFESNNKKHICDCPEF